VKARRVSFVFLSAYPFLVLALASPRPLRIPILHQSLGVVVCALGVAAAWILGARTLISEGAEGRTAALAGSLLFLPLALIALLWVGIGPPFQATLEENHMRFLVLLANAILVFCGFVALKEALSRSGESWHSTLGLAAGLAGGTAYILCISISVAQTIALQNGQDRSLLMPLVLFYDVIEFVACLLTYAATGWFALSMSRAGWFGRGAARAYVAVCALFVALLLARGLTFPEISARTEPWYTRPAVIAGIPAVPWVMPFLLGVVALRRAGAQSPGSMR
jgi:hypothetical protein